MPFQDAYNIFYSVNYHLLVTHRQNVKSVKQLLAGPFHPQQGTIIQQRDDWFTTAHRPPHCTKYNSNRKWLVAYLVWATERRPSVADWDITEYTVGQLSVSVADGEHCDVISSYQSSATAQAIKHCSRSSSLTLWKAEVSTGYTLPSRSNLHF